MKRYFFDSSGEAKVVTDMTFPLTSVKCDDILDKSNFQPNAESIRKSVITGNGLSKKGVYDTNRPSAFMLQLRSGKLDKAEVSDYIRENSSKAVKDSNEAIESLKTSSDSTKSANDMDGKAKK